MELVEEPDDKSKSIPIARCRELLGDEAEALTDQEIELIRRHAETMACMVVEMYLEHVGFPSRNRASETCLARARRWI